MLAALATVIFLATLWLIVSVAVQTLSDSGGKIVAALKGRSILAEPSAVAPVAVRISLRSRPQPVVHAQPRLRAAA